MSALRTIIYNRSYLSLALIFLTNSMLEGSWIVYIPYLTEKLGIGAGLLGLALFCKAGGSFISLPFIPGAIKTLGEGRFTFITAILFCLAIPLIVLMPTYLSFCIVLFFAGSFGTMMDIGMNALVSNKEKTDKVYIMSASHGFWSLGGMLGAGLASLISAKINQPFVHIAILSLLLILMQIIISGNYRNTISGYEKTKFDFSKIKAPILLLAFVCFIIMMGEGIVADWSSLYLKNIVLSPPALLGMGYAGFSAAMAIGRFNADRISSRFGARSLIIWGFLISIVGIGLVLTTSEALTLVGFTIMGIGYSGIIPELFRLASNLKNVTPSQGITIVAGLGYFGFLVGPVCFGYVAEVYDLRTSFGIFSIILILALFLFSFNRSNA